MRDGAVSRTWMWGPQAFTGHMQESYAEGANGQRTVLYHDKSRMEITTPSGDPNSIWYVSNGLLVTELVTGRLQLGNNAFEQHTPAQINVAGDADDAAGPTYATFGTLLGVAPTPVGATITQTVNRAGVIQTDPSLSGYGVTAAIHVPETNHTVASVFWEFMNAQGLVYESGGLQTAALFQNPFYATGFPISEPYWATVKVGGTYKVVLVQIFERRVLTYTSGNSAGWQVEAGNVGQHYFHWRYELIPG